MFNEKCPICGHELIKICYTSYPPQYGYQCLVCGWVSPKSSMQNPIKYSNITTKERAIRQIATEFSEHFCIPCDLCNKYFAHDGSCPPEVKKCNGIYHWCMLMERIMENEKD